MKNKTLAVVVRKSLSLQAFYEFSYFVCGMEWSLPNLKYPPGLPLAGLWRTMEN
jgi:hypothetical protein